jgi:hypothetical protein
MNKNIYNISLTDAQQKELKELCNITWWALGLIIIVLIALFFSSCGQRMLNLGI